MDWKFSSIAAKEFLPFAQEEFLITLANKGLYKRALKDLEASKQDWDAKVFGESTSFQGIEVQMEGVTVTLRREVAKSTCTCPSKTVCKHILMALLWVGELAEKIQEDSTDSHPEPTADAITSKQEGVAGELQPFAALRQVDLSALRRKAGKRVFDEALNLVQEGWTAEINQGEMLSAFLPTDGFSVFFPPEDSIEGAVCKCGALGLCRHKLVGIFSWLRLQGLLENGGEEGQEFLAPDASTMELLGTADAFLLGTLDKGIMNCGESDGERAIQLSIKLDTQGIGNLSRLFRGFATDIEGLREKNAAFSSAVALKTVARLHNTFSLLLKHPEDGRLFGSLVERSRSEYHSIPIGHFVGLGVYPWKTRSGYSGCTAFLYHRETERVCTYGMSMANYYENTRTERVMEIHQGVHWREALSLVNISSSQLRLENFKINHLCRLSSGKLTAAQITGKTDMAALKDLPIAVGPGALPEQKREPYSYFSKKQSETVVALRTTMLQEVVYDRAAQALFFFLGDETGETVPGKIYYSRENERAVRRMEHLGREAIFPESYFICLCRGGYLLPVSMVTEQGVDSFYFEEGRD